ncbi:dde superfamily endonuclease [Holotrichia oblita]|uniref:Dde superfamily endonuclease n=1 Tax=Holotrichia oblita TaxID=644536 RepID=A0ACB9TQI3_HOLOL|nr:dde superfamily endonuclease [Holotrichia oblita]
MNEKGCHHTLHHQQSVLSKTGAKRLHRLAPEHLENVTVVGCVSAFGSAVPPMILFKGKRLKPEFEDNLPASTLMKMAPILLVLDGAKCHLDFTIVYEAENHEISLICLPSNTALELQPLDKASYTGKYIQKKG